MTVFVICLLTSQQTAIRKKETSLCTSQRRKYVSQTSPLLSLLPKASAPTFPKKKKWKRIKLLSLSPNKHKLFWHLINRQYSIVLRARQVCLPHSWWIPLFCMESLLAFLSNVVTHLSLSCEGKLWKMAKSNYTEPSPLLPPRVFSHSSPLKAGGKNLLSAAIFHRQMEGRHVGVVPLISLCWLLAH